MENEKPAVRLKPLPPIDWAKGRPDPHAPYLGPVVPNLSDEQQMDCWNRENRAALTRSLSAAASFTKHAPQEKSAGALGLDLLHAGVRVAIGNSLKNAMPDADRPIQPWENPYEQSHRTPPRNPAESCSR